LREFFAANQDIDQGRITVLGHFAAMHRKRQSFARNEFRFFGLIQPIHQQTRFGIVSIRNLWLKSDRLIVVSQCLR
jgi:hypothetical protein